MKNYTNQNRPSKECWLTESEVSELIGVTRATLQNWRWRGVGLPYSKFMRSVRYKESDLAQDGACIEVYFEKNRALYGDDVKPFEARLESNTNDDGIKTLSWTCKSLEDSTFDTVCALANKGLGNWEIAQELEIHKSTVSRYVNRGKEEGIIKPLNS